MRHFNCIKDFSLKILKISSARIHAARWNKQKTIFILLCLCKLSKCFQSYSLTAAPALRISSAYILCNSFFFNFRWSRKLPKRNNARALPKLYVGGLQEQPNENEQKKKKLCEKQP